MMWNVIHVRRGGYRLGVHDLTTSCSPKGSSSYWLRTHAILLLEIVTYNPYQKIHDW